MTFTDICKELQNYTTLRFSDVEYTRGKHYYDFDIKDYNYNKNLVFVRHDIDVDIDTAIKMAKIEEEHGIRSTYFALCNPDVAINGMYFEGEDNIAESLEKLKQIQDMGHEIGIHHNLIGDYFDNKK